MRGEARGASSRGFLPYASILRARHGLTDRISPHYSQSVGNAGHLNDMLG
jgi:hypothetical protein